MSYQLTPRPPYTVERPPPPRGDWIGCWVGHRASLNIVVKNSVLSRNETPIFGRQARSAFLYRLNYTYTCSVFYVVISSMRYRLEDSNVNQSLLCVFFFFQISISLYPVEGTDGPICIAFKTSFVSVLSCQWVCRMLLLI
jgi:hypothetical protein